MKKQTILDDYLVAQQEEHERNLDYFADRWGVTRGLISRWRTAAKRIGIDKAWVVFADIHRWNGEPVDEMVKKYFDDYPELHRRFLERKEKFDRWDSSLHENTTPICGRCGDTVEVHKTGPCSRCDWCRGYVPRVRRGRPTNDSRRKEA